MYTLLHRENASEYIIQVYICVRIYNTSLHFLLLQKKMLVNISVHCYMIMQSITYEFSIIISDLIRNNWTIFVV